MHIPWRGLHNLRIVSIFLTDSGQTGAGKTYTMVGNCPELNSDAENYKVSLLTDERGILPRALQRVFDEQTAKRDSRVTISFFEIYN
jgi:hypothetical protein